MKRQHSRCWCWASVAAGFGKMEQVGLAYRVLVGDGDPPHGWCTNCGTVGECTDSDDDPCAREASLGKALKAVGKFKNRKADTKKAVEAYAETRPVAVELHPQGDTHAPGHAVVVRQTVSGYLEVLDPYGPTIASGDVAGLLIPVASGRLDIRQTGTPTRVYWPKGA